MSALLPRRTVLAVFAAAGCALAAAPSASAGAGDAVIRDCVAGQRSFPSATLPELRAALEDLPSDIREYTECESLIEAAQAALVGGSRRSGTPYVAKSDATDLPAGAAAAPAAAGFAPAPAGGDDAGADAPVGEDGAPAGEDGGADRDAAAPGPAGADAPSYAPIGDDEFLAVPAAGPGLSGAAAGGDGVPLVPVAIALSVVALGGARALVLRGRRGEDDLVGSGPA